MTCNWWTGGHCWHQIGRIKKLLMCANGVPLDGMLSKEYHIEVCCNCQKRRDSREYDGGGW